MGRSVDAAPVAVRARLGYSTGDVVLIAGAPRSGTTWIGELVAGALGAPLIFEPDNVHHGVGWSQRPRFGLNEATTTLYTQSLHGRRRPLGSVRFGMRAIRSRRLVVKSVHVLPQLPAIHDLFPDLTSILIVRHPCAVVASRLERGFGINPIDEIAPPALVARFPQLAAAIAEVDSEPAQHALRWSVDHLAVTQASAASRQRWTTLSYEQLVAHEPRAIASLAGALGVELDAVGSRLGRPSRTARGRETFGDLDRWHAALGEMRGDERVRAPR